MQAPRVGFVLKREKPEAVEIARELVPVLLAQGVAAVVPHEHAALVPGARAIDEPAMAAGVDLLVVLGGDGTLLHGAGLVGDRGVPILGVNLGRLGFLTPFDPHEARAALQAALAGELEVEERMRLRVTLCRNGGERLTRFACNDAVINQGALARLLDLDVGLDGQKVSTYKADGLIIATPTGSTAYTLAAGGPILTPDVRAIVITAICPHTLTNRPLVVPASSKLSVRLASRSRHVMLTIDGQWGLELGALDHVEVRRADHPLRVLRSPDRPYFEILRDKLRWGEREG